MKKFYPSIIAVLIILAGCINPEESMPVGKYLDYLPDDDYNIERVISDTSLQWTRNETDIINWGYRDTDYWFRLDIKDIAFDYKFLTLDYALIDYITVYLKDGEKSVPVYSGDGIAFNKRDINHVYPVFPIRENLFHDRYIYIRIRNEGAYTFPFYLKTDNGFISTTLVEYTIFFAVIAILISMIIYNLIIFISVKDKSYIYYIFFILVFIFAIGSLDAISFQFLWGNNPQWASISIPVFLMLVGITMNLYTIEFLEIKKTSKWIYRSLIAIIGLMIINLLLSLTISYSSIIKIVTVTMMVSSIYLISIGIIFLTVYKKKSARYFLSAWVILLVSFIIYALKNLGLTGHNFITNHGVKIAVVIEAILLSLALTDKINILRKEKEDAQRNALETEKKLRDEAERRLRITQIYTRKSIVESIENGLDPTTFEPQNKAISILFSDIRDFTSISELFGTIETVNLLNRYFNHMNQCVMSHKGEIDKLIGDCIMALFYNPGNAVKAAIDMRKKLFEFNKIAKYKVRIENGIGINFGNVIVGNIGSESKMDYTVIGDIVNSASRIESLTKYYGVSIIISGEIKDKLSENHDIRFIDEVYVKGRATPIRIFEVYDYYSDEIKNLIWSNTETYDKIYEYYKNADFKEAYKHYKKLMEQLGEHNYIQGKCKDPLVGYYMQRCLELQDKLKKGLLTEWSGVYNFEKK
jgi:adenylate cyclase